ncbi:MAG: choice-of-anchor D domain-containing protein, partial [Myxococcota bacterium]|nr:choice-of-anchor D domain-containing protein [Myxococcota bacterium]
WFDQGVGEDFAIVEGLQLPIEVAPSLPIGLQVSYTPSGGGADTGWLMAEANDGQDLYQVLVTGSEIGPALAAFPDPVDFGWRAVGQTHTLPLNISNDGTLPLQISTMDWEGWSSPTLALQGGPDAGGATLEPGEVLSTTISFTPTSDMVPTTAPIGGILIESNDASTGGAQIVPVYGKAEVPVLQVNPPELVDFAFVAQNNTSSRTVNLYNAGSAPVDIYELLVEDNPTGEFALKVDESWGPTSGTPTAGTIPAGAHQQFKVTFTNEGADSGTQWGKLRILSNDSQTPDWELSLKAQRAGSPICEVGLVPDTLDFGIVPRGFTKTMSMSLVVNGSGNCSFHSVFANDCDSWGGFFGTSCDDPEGVIQMDGNSSYYTLSHQIPAIAGFLQPGDSFPIEVTFTPPDTAPIFGDEMTDYGGLLGVRVLDPAAPGAAYEIFPKPQVGGGIGGGFAANLHAQSGLAELSVFPGELDFGLTTIGCHSQTLTVNAYNVGTAPLDLTNWELQGCSPEFKVKSWPAVPITLDPQEGVQFELVYVPQDEGGDSCGLALTTAASETPAVVVPLEGAGTFEDHQIDEFIQSSGQDVDVLFIVDDSGSMGEEQNNLSSNLLAFVNEAATWSND